MTIELPAIIQCADHLHDNPIALRRLLFDRTIRCFVSTDISHRCVASVMVLDKKTLYNRLVIVDLRAVDSKSARLLLNDTYLIVNDILNIDYATDTNGLNLTKIDDIFGDNIFVAQTKSSTYINGFYKGECIL